MMRPRARECPREADFACRLGCRWNPGYTQLSAMLWALPAAVDVEARACFLDVEPLGRLSPGDSL
jgi:hypothetical protein